MLHSVAEYQRIARDRLSRDVWDFVQGGSGAERTLAANRHAFANVTLRPRVLVDVSTCDTATTLFGQPLRAPIGVAPLAYHRLVHPDGEVATAAGASAAGVLYVISMFASCSFADIAAAVHNSPLWIQLYWLTQRDRFAEVVTQAAAAGCTAMVLTVDAPRIGRRLRDLRNGFFIDSSIRAVNVDHELMAAVHERREGESAIATHARLTFDQTITWRDLAWLRGLTGLPLLLKGVLTAEDARRAIDHGVDGIVVSNHGGRQLDGAPASLDALVEVVDAVAGAVPVLIDGGVRSGADVFTALALGADAVLLGRPVLWALAAGGAAGVGDLLRLVTEELENTMVLCGRPRLADIDRSAVCYRPR